jgi:polyhydroxybutyrate depolymerase
MKSAFTKNLTIFSLFILFNVSPQVFAQWEKYIIDNTLNKPEVVAIGDLNGDTKPDVIVNDINENKVIWYENNVTNPFSPWIKYIIDSNLAGAYVTDIGDLDGDGDLDVAASGYQGKVVVWYENNHPDWNKHTIAENLTVSGAVSIADIDGDDKLDIVSSGYRNGGDLVWYENNHPTWTRHTIRSNYSTEWSWIGDIDGDGAIDVAVARWNENEVNWFRNENAGLSWTEFIIDDSLEEASHLYIGDIDGDNDMDITAAGASEDVIVWYENNHPDWSRHTIDNNLERAWCVVVVDIDGDEKPDVAATGKNPGKVVWYKNNHPEWKKDLVDANLDGANLLLSADIDNDNALDIVVPGVSAHNVVWYKNPYSSQTIEDSFEFEGLERDYIVYLPSNFQTEMPLVINLHGSLPDDAEWMMGYARMNEIADTAGFVLVYPNSTSPRWNANSGIPNIAEPDVNDVGFISALIDTLIVNYNVDTNRIYCCGLNYGGWMASELICQIGHRFAAGARVNTSLGFNQADRSTLEGAFPIVLFNGTADSYLPWPDGKAGVMSGPEAIGWWVEQNECALNADTVSLPDLDPTDNCTVEKISYTDCSDETKVVFYKVLNGGLSWPGAVGNETWDKPRNMDINAGVEIWNFFKDYEKSQDNIVTEKWYRQADMKTARKSHSSCVLDGKIYVFAGKGSTATLNSVEVYNPVQNSWTQMADMNSGRVVFSTCGYNGKIIAIGGSETMNGSPITSIEEYDPITNVWINKTEMPVGRIGATATIIGDKIYIIGGINSSKTTLIQQIDVLDMVSGEWTVVTSLPTPRMNLSSVSFNEKIYTIGGTLGSANGYLGLDKVEVYNPDTDTWSDAASMINNRKNFAACELDGNIYVFGGSNLDCGGILSSVEAYDPILNIWIEKSNMPSILGGPSAVQFDNKIYISGGSTTACPATPQSTIYEYSDPITSISQDSKEIAIPKNFVMSQNYPNPFNPTTTIKYSIPYSFIPNSVRDLSTQIPDQARNDNVILKVYDILGREVATLVNQKQKPGNYEVEWNAINQPSGVYFYQLQTGDFIETKKMILMK